MAATVPEIIKQRLQNSQITDAAIIDETFDGVSNEVIAKDLRTFLAALEDDDTFKQAQVICAELEEADDFDLDCAKISLHCFPARAIAAIPAAPASAIMLLVAQMVA